VKYVEENRNETLYFNNMWQSSGSGNDSRWLQSKHIFVGEARIVTKSNWELSPGVTEGNLSFEAGHQYWYHGDHLGSAQVVTDRGGQLHERLEYTPYGEIWVEHKYDTSEGSLPYRFTGKELDTETGYYYFGARYLDPKTSRWISVDPAMGEYIPSAPVNDEAKKRNGNLPGQGGVFNFVNLHVYHYAGNNPVKYVDPDGNDYFYAIYHKSTNTITATYIDTKQDGKNMSFSGIKTYSFSVTNNVVSGMRKTTTSSGESKWYFPKKFPNGMWNIFKSKEKSGQPAFGDVFIPTDAHQTVDTYGSGDLPKPLPDENGNYTVTGTQEDSGYGAHFSIFDETLGCIKFDSQADADKFAELSDKAINSTGGKSVLTVTD